MAVVALVALYFHNVPENPPGFFVDEASIAYNAQTVARGGRDEHGESWPLYFRAFGEYKSPVYIYLLAAIFKLRGVPSIAAARLLSAAAGLLAAALLGLLAWRVARSKFAGAVVFVSALLTPWLFELSRLVFEVALMPLAVALFLLLLYRASEKEDWSWLHAAALGASLGLITYTYSAGRLLAPLYALGLALFITRVRWRGVVRAWLAFGVTLLPLFVFTRTHPGALGERFKYVTFVKPGDTGAEIVARFVKNLIGNFSPWSWLVAGDPEPRHHLPGTLAGSVLVATAMLCLVGLVIILRRHRRDAWWRFVVYGLVASAIPSSLTLDHFHTLRLAAMPVFLLTFAAPAVAWFLERDDGGERMKHARRVALAALVFLTLTQGLVFQWQFQRAAPTRAHQFDSFYAEIFDAAAPRAERPIYLHENYPAAYVYAYWYAALRGMDTTHFRRINKDESPPPGALVISHEIPCANCELILERGPYRLYLAR